MKRVLKILFFVFYYCHNPQAGFGQNGLTSKQNFTGSARTDAKGFTINNFGFVIGGDDVSVGFLSDVWRYNADSNNWRQMNVFPGIARQGAACIGLGNKAYYGLGWSNGNSLQQDFWEYDSDLDIWKKMKDFPKSGRMWAATFSVNKKIYVGTGTTIGPSNNELWEFDPDSNTWNRKADVPGGNRFKAIGFSFRNKGYIGTGFNESSSTLYSNDFWEYNPDSNTWKQKSSIGSSGLAGAIAFVIDTTPYIALGTGDLGGSLNTYNHHLYAYNAVKDTWNVVANFGNISRESAASFVIGKKAYFGTGLDPKINYYQDWWEFDPSLVSVFVPENKLNNYEFKIIPNPNNGKFLMEFNGFINNEMDAEVYNQLGEVVWRNKFIINSGENKFEIQTNDLNSGLYFIKVSGPDFYKAERIIIR